MLTKRNRNITEIGEIIFVLILAIMLICSCSEPKKVIYHYDYNIKQLDSNNDFHPPVNLNSHY